MLVDSLALCAEAGMATVGVAAVDSVKMAADASKKANRSDERIAAQADEMMAKAKQADAAEGRLLSEARGDEPPAQPRDRSRRLRRLKQATQRGGGRGRRRA